MKNIKLGYLLCLIALLFSISLNASSQSSDQTQSPKQLTAEQQQAIWYAGAYLFLNYEDYYPSYNYIYSVPYHPYYPMYSDYYYIYPYYGSYPPYSPAYAQSCSIWTDKPSYKVGEMVTIYCNVPTSTTASFTEYMPDGSVAWQIDPRSIDAGTSSRIAQAWYPTGQRRIVIQTSDGCSSTAYFNVYP